MHEYKAIVRWIRDGAKFTDNRYSRGHEWVFDGGVTVPASSSPQVVPAPLSRPEAVDPEEALVASAASCHMLFFLSLAARRGFVVERYVDEPTGVMAENPVGRLAFRQIVLRPQIEFSHEAAPTAEQLKALHRDAHDQCYIANSLRCEVVVE